MKLLIQQLKRYLISWIKKTILREIKSLKNKNSPPKMNETRWNSSFNCLSYIFQNLTILKEIHLLFGHTHFKCPIEFSNDDEKKLNATYIKIKPKIDFSNNI